jgi:hypothetical protein
MPIFKTYLAGMAVAHGFWFYFFITGHLLRPKGLKESRSFSITDLIVTSVAGMAVAGFCLLFLGFTHLLNRTGISLSLLCEGVLFLWLKGENWLSCGFWRRIFRRFVEAWTLPALLVYLLFLILGMPAVLPPTFADSVTYHLAYAVDWANAGRICVDPFLRFPYYANNFLLFYSALFVLKLGNSCHFLNWLCGLLTCLGVLAFFTPVRSQFGERMPKWKLSRPQHFLIPVCVALSPVFLRYLNIGYIDIPIGLFALTVILCTYRTSPSRPLERELVVTAAFCAGMKLTLIGHLPFFLGSLFFATARRLPRRQIAVLCLLLVSLSLPWYLRNLFEAHDPTPPVFNFFFKQPDPIFTKAGDFPYTADTITEREPFHLLLLPFRFFIDPQSKDFRESGITALILLLYAPTLFLVVQVCLWNRWRAPPVLIYLSLAVVYLAFPWLFSSLGRYCLHWYPVLAAWVGVIVSDVCAQTENLWNSRLATSINRTVTAVFCTALIIPSPSQACVHFYRNYYALTASLLRSHTTLKAYLKKHLSGYLAGQAVIATLVSNQKSNTKVFLSPDVLGLIFYFRKAKIIAVGDYFGPARYKELWEEVEQGNCLPYLSRLDISAVIVTPHYEESWWSPLYDKFQSQLKQNGFSEYRTSEHNVVVFLRDDIRPSPKLSPLINKH